MNKPFEEIEFTPEDIYEELVKSGIEFELNEEYKYLEDSLAEDEKKFVNTMKNMEHKYREDGQFSEQGMKEYIEQIRKNSRNTVTLMIVKEEDL